jgi:hypothetical protein
MQCPPPIQQKDSDVKGDLEANAQTLLRIGTLQLKGAAQKTVVDLFSKYPNADRVAIANAIISMTCNLLNKSNLPDSQKWERWQNIVNAIMAATIPALPPSGVSPTPQRRGDAETGMTFIVR